MSAVKRHSKILVASNEQVAKFAEIFGIEPHKITSITVDWFDDDGYIAELLDGVVE